MSVHVPVMLAEAFGWLAPRPGQHFIDGTVGGGGHAEAILERTSPDGRLLGLDRDPQAIRSAAKRLARFGERVVLVQASYSQIQNLNTTDEFISAARFSGALLDLGLSLDQLKVSGKGFSFLNDEPLDLRFDHTRGQTAAALIGSASLDSLTAIFRSFGQERLARPIAQAIVSQRQAGTIVTSGQLAELILSVYRQRLGSRRAVPWIGGRHPATKVFQALRIAVNDELGELERGLPAVLERLSSGGRLVVISYHSLEDRIVKHFFRQRSRLGHLNILTKKPLIPSDDETENNPSSRSAKMRVAEKK